VTLSRRELAAHLGRLAGTLAELKSRVRDAVATETGKAVAGAVKDLLTAALGGRPAVEDRGRGYRPDRRRDSDDDGGYWDDDPEDDDDDDGPHTPPCRTSTGWPVATRLATLAARGWATGRLTGWAAAGLGLLAVTAAASGGPVAQAGLALVTTAADLLPHLFTASF
jgi:hypothetical protein